MKINQVEHFLDAEFREFEIGQKKFPILFRVGIADAAVHAAGIGYLLSLGLEYGLPVIPEYPITLHAPPKWKQVGRVLPDSVWFHPETFNPWISFEFERFERGDENKIREKMENLAISYHQSGGTIELCVFIYWLRSSLAPKTVAPLFKAFSKGFDRHRVKIPPPDCKLLVYKVVMCQTKNAILPARQILMKETPVEYKTTGGNQELLILQEIQEING